MLPRKNLALKISRRLPWDTFWTRKRLSKYPGHSFNLMVQLHPNFQKDLLCRHLCLKKNLASKLTQIFNVRRIRRVNRHPVESDEDSTSASILDTEDWLNWNGDLDNPNDSENDCATNIESDIQHHNSWNGQRSEK